MERGIFEKLKLSHLIKFSQMIKELLTKILMKTGYAEQTE